MSDIVERLRNSLLKGDDPRLHKLRNADLAEAAAEIERLRVILYEIVTNGEWTDGEQRGDWKISNEVYMMAKDEVDRWEVRRALEGK